MLLCFINPSLPVLFELSMLHVTCMLKHLILGGKKKKTSLGDFTKGMYVCASSPIGVGSSLLKHAETKKLHQFSSRMLKPSIFAGDSKQNTKIKYAVFWSSGVFLLLLFFF